MNNTIDLSNAAPRPSVRISPLWRNSPKQLRSALASARRLRFFVLFVCAGYQVQGRTFAYLGVPGFYPGEALLLWTALKGKGGWLDTFRSELRAKPLLPLAVISFLAWGAIETLRGFGGGYSLGDSLRGLATHYYPLLLFVGLSAARYVSFDLMRKYFNNVNVLVGLAVAASTLVVGRYHAGFSLPWKQDVFLPGVPVGGCLLFAVAFARRMDTRFVISSSFAMLAMLLGPRSSILGAMVGVLFLLCRRKRRALTAALLAGTAVTYAFVAAFLPGLLPDFGGRVGALTPARVTARVTAIFDRDLASRIASGAGEDDSFVASEAGTADWRKEFWNAVIDSMATRSDWMIGHGYGFSLGSLLTGIAGFNDTLRTPHNFAIYLLGYTGLVGCALYACLLLAFIAEVARCPGSPVRDGIIAGGLSVMLSALSGNVLETPFGAVPTYLMFGILLGLARQWRPAAPGRWPRSLASGRRAPLHLSADAPRGWNFQVPR